MSPNKENEQALRLKLRICKPGMKRQISVLLQHIYCMRSEETGVHLWLMTCLTPLKFG